MTDDKVKLMSYAVSDSLDRLSRLFVPGVKLTFIARYPGNVDCDVFISEDTMPEVIELIQRRMAEDDKP